MLICTFTVLIWHKSPFPMLRNIILPFHCSKNDWLLTALAKVLFPPTSPHPSIVLSVNPLAFPCICSIITVCEELGQTHWGAFNGFPQRMFSWTNKKSIYLDTGDMNTTYRTWTPKFPRRLSYLCRWPYIALCSNIMSSQNTLPHFLLHSTLYNRCGFLTQSRLVGKRKWYFFSFFLFHRARYFTNMSPY